MKAVIQRVSSGSVSVAGECIGRIGKGLVVLLGISRRDTQADADYLAEKIINLRIFEDRDRKMNLALADVAGGLLVISQFTLLADCRKGRRPSFGEAARPDEAGALYTYFVDRVRSARITVATGRFGSEMAVSLVNDGPVTIILDSMARPAGKAG